MARWGATPMARAASGGRVCQSVSMRRGACALSGGFALGGVWREACWWRGNEHATCLRRRPSLALHGLHDDVRLPHRRHLDPVRSVRDTGWVSLSLSHSYSHSYFYSLSLLLSLLLFLPALAQLINYRKTMWSWFSFVRGRLQGEQEVDLNNNITNEYLPYFVAS